jgi:hypothetical protein
MTKELQRYFLTKEAQGREPIDWLHWLRRLKELGTQEFRRPRSPKRDRTVQAIHEIWPNGGIEYEMAEERQRKIEAWCQDQGFSKPSRRTVNRAMRKVRAISEVRAK